MELDKGENVNVSLYTKEVREFFLSRDWPKGIVVDVRENDEPEPHLNLIFFRDNWLTLGVREQIQATNIVKEIMDKLWGDGVPTYVGKMEHAAE